MNLYREVLIKSAEQAEALPLGTIAYRNDMLAPGDVIYPQGHASRETATRFRSHAIRDDWSEDGWLQATMHESEVRPNVEVVGWTALMPIEAEVRELRTACGDEITYYEAWVTEEPGP